MAIPTYGGPKVQPQAAPSFGQHQFPNEGYGELAQGLAQGAQGLAAGVGAFLKSQHEQTVVEARNELTAFGDDNTLLAHGDIKDPKNNPGLFSVKGEAAIDAANLALEELETRRQDRRGKLSSDSARQLFDAESEKMMSSARARFGAYVDQQIEVAKTDSVNSAADEAMRAVSLDPANDQLAKERVAGVVGPIHALAGGREDFANQKSLEVQGEVAKARIDALLSAGDWEKAEKVLTSDKNAIGTKADEYVKRIDQVKGVEEAQTLAFGVMKGAISDDGQVNQTAALDGLANVPEKLRSKVEPILYKLMAEREQAYSADTKRISTSAFSLYNNKGWAEFEKSGLSTELNYRNPELYHRLKDDARQQVARAKLNKSEQKALDDIVVNEFKGMPDQLQEQMDLGQFTVGRQMSDEGKSRLEPLKKAAADRVAKGASPNKELYVAAVLAQARPYTSQGTGKQQRERKAAVIARAVDDYSALFYEHEGKVPPEAARKSQAAQLVEILAPGARGAEKALVDLTSSGNPDAPRMVKVKHRKSGKTGVMPATNFNPQVYELIQ